MENALVAIHPAGNPEEEPTGRVVLDGRQCQYGNVIKAGDLVVANFDAKRVHTGGGLYLLQTADGWRGCRRMMRVPEGIAIDQDGHGDWATFRSMEEIRWRVVGTVETVYKATQV